MIRLPGSRADKRPVEAVRRDLHLLEPLTTSRRAPAEVGILDRAGVVRLCDGLSVLDSAVYAAPTPVDALLRGIETPSEICGSRAVACIG